MHAGIELMYVEGEVKDGCCTGRTVLVIETTLEIGATGSSTLPPNLLRLVRDACNEWEAYFPRADLVRLEHHTRGALEDLEPPSVTTAYSR